ncbi:outer membrane beta-barrel protein [Marinomonas sp. THO17]|uniref:outer membrane beta-barrel protein n=1 Tax=Marinomonas sp. THO17 TaxID=3149048 RepID=UPI00336BC4D4
MMRLCILLLSWLIPIMSVPVLADTRGYDLELGPNLSYLEYGEHGDIEQYGFLFGVQARYSSYHSFSVLLVDLAYSGDKITQKSAGKIEQVNNDIINFRSMIGRALYLVDGYRITPYLGLGYRRSTLDSRDRVSSTLIEGYKSQQTYFYNPVGIEFQALESEAGWLMGARIEYELVLIARNRTRLSAEENYRVIETDLSNGRGYHFSLKFKRLLNQEGGGFVIEPFYKYWFVKEAERSDLREKTANHSSNEWGVSFLVAF